MKQILIFALFIMGVGITKGQLVIQDLRPQSFESQQDSLELMVTALEKKFEDFFYKSIKANALAFEVLEGKDSCIFSPGDLFYSREDFTYGIENMNCASTILYFEDNNLILQAIIQNRNGKIFIHQGTLLLEYQVSPEFERLRYENRILYFHCNHFGAVEGILAESAKERVDPKDLILFFDSAVEQLNSD